MKKEPFAFNMQNYVIQNPGLRDLTHGLILSKPSGFDLTRYFPAAWRYKSATNIQLTLPKICSDALLIKTSMRNAECRQLTFVQNFFRQSQEYQENPAHAQEFARDLRKKLSISTLSSLLFSNFEIYLVKCEVMDGFAQAKKEEISMESWIKANGCFLDLEIVEATEKFLSPYETDFIGFFVFPRNTGKALVPLTALKKEFQAINEYHKKNYIFSTKHL